MLAVIDYGAGNLHSVLHALHHLGTPNIRVVRHGHELRDAEKIILPGVGAFGAGMEALHKQDLIKPLLAAIYMGKPYLGICLGMQFLFEYSHELGNHKGLGVIPGRVAMFPKHMGLKVPHMGWNQLRIKQPSPLLEGIDGNSYAYFVHSYYCEPTREEDVLATVDYGITFTAVVAHSNVYGVQFHPEKSQTTGLQILKNFLYRIEGASV